MIFQVISLEELHHIHWNSYSKVFLGNTFFYLCLLMCFVNLIIYLKSYFYDPELLLSVFANKSVIVHWISFTNFFYMFELNLFFFFACSAITWCRLTKVQSFNGNSLIGSKAVTISDFHSHDYRGITSSQLWYYCIIYGNLRGENASFNFVCLCVLSFFESLWP